MSSPSCEGLGEERGVTNGVELELVDGVKTDGWSCLGGVGVAGIMFGVPGCLNGVAIVLPLGLGLGPAFESSYFPLVPGGLPWGDGRRWGVVRKVLGSSSEGKRSMLSFSTMVSGEARASSKSRSVGERLRCWARMSSNPSLLLVFDATTGLNPDGKEDGGGTGERGWWPLKSDARVIGVTKPLKKHTQGWPVSPLGEGDSEEAMGV